MLAADRSGSAKARLAMATTAKSLRVNSDSRLNRNARPSTDRESEQFSHSDPGALPEEIGRQL